MKVSCPPTVLMCPNVSNRRRLQEFPDSSKSRPSSSPSSSAKGPSRPLMHHIANSRLINFFNRYVGLCPKCLCLSNLVTYSLSHHLSLVMLQNHAKIGATKAKLWKHPPSCSMPPRAISHHCHRSGTATYGGLTYKHALKSCPTQKMRQ